MYKYIDAYELTTSMTSYNDLIDYGIDKRYLDNDLISFIKVSKVTNDLPIITIIYHNTFFRNIQDQNIHSKFSFTYNTNKKT